MVKKVLLTFFRSFTVTPFHKGYEQAQKGNHEKAISFYEKAIKNYPNSAGAYNNCGVCRAALGNHKAAIEDYDKALTKKRSMLMFTAIEVFQKWLWERQLLLWKTILRRLK